MRTVKWIALALFLFLALLAAAMLLRGVPARGALVLLGAGAAGAWAVHRSLGRDAEAQGREERERVAGMQREVIGLAARRQGVLTVTDVVADLGYTVDWAEHVLASLDDGVRVSARVADEGIVVYEFREVMHRQRRLGGAQGGARA